jgi:hypothetical protein
MFRSIWGLRRLHAREEEMMQRLRRRLGGIVGGLFV